MWSSDTEKTQNVLKKFRIFFLQLIIYVNHVANFKFNCFFSPQVTLYDLLNTLNVTPNYVIGYSIGDLICAYADGHFTLEAVITAAYHCAAFLAKRYENTKNTITVLAGKLEQVFLVNFLKLELPPPPEKSSLIPKILQIFSPPHSFI